MTRALMALVVCIGIFCETWNPKKPTSFLNTESPHVEALLTVHSKDLFPECLGSGPDLLFLPPPRLDHVSMTRSLPPANSIPCMVCPTETARLLRLKNMACNGSQHPGMVCPTETACPSHLDGPTPPPIYLREFMSTSPKMLFIHTENITISFYGVVDDIFQLPKANDSYDFFSSPSARSIACATSLDIFCMSHGTPFNLPRVSHRRRVRLTAINESGFQVLSILAQVLVFGHFITSVLFGSVNTNYNYALFTEALPAIFAMVVFAYVIYKYDYSHVRMLLCGFIIGCFIDGYNRGHQVAVGLIWTFMPRLVATANFYPRLFYFSVALLLFEVYSLFIRRIASIIEHARELPYEDFNWYYDVPCTKVKQNGIRVYWFKRYFNDGSVVSLRQCNTYEQANRLRSVRIEHAQGDDLENVVFDLSFLRCYTPQAFCGTITMIANLYKFYEVGCPSSVYVTYIVSRLVDFLGPALLRLDYKNLLLTIKSFLIDNSTIIDDHGDDFSAIDAKLESGLKDIPWEPPRRPLIIKHGFNTRYEPTFMSKLLMVGGCVFAVSSMPSWSSISVVQNHLEYNKFNQIAGSVVSVYDVLSKFCSYTISICMSLSHCLVTNEWYSTLFGAGKFRLEVEKLRLCHNNIHMLTSQDDCISLPYTNIFNYEIALEKAITQCKEPIVIPNGEKTQLLRDLEGFKRTLDHERLTGSPRKTPWCAVVYGDSGIGKSTITDMLFTIVAKVYDLPIGSHTKEYVYTHNASSKFWDTCRSHHWGYLFDDMACEKPSLLTAERSSNQPLLHVQNNTPVVATMADVSQKGKVACRPRCAIITTNNKTLNAQYTNAFPAAVLRRPTCFLRPVPIDEVCQRNTTQIDSEKFSAHVDAHGIGKQWLWSVERCVTNPEPTSTGYKFEYYKHEGIELRNVEFEVFSEWIVKSLHAHDAIQTKVVHTMRTLCDKIHYCKCVGSLTHAPCQQCTPIKIEHALEQMDKGESQDSNPFLLRIRRYFRLQSCMITQSLCAGLQFYWNRMYNNYFLYKPAYWRISVADAIFYRFGSCASAEAYRDKNFPDADFISYIASENNCRLIFKDGVTVGSSLTRIVQCDFEYPVQGVPYGNDLLCSMVKLSIFSPLLVLLLIPMEVRCLLLGASIVALYYNFYKWSAFVSGYYAVSRFSSFRFRARHLVAIAGILVILLASITRIKQMFSVEQGNAISQTGQSMPASGKSSWWSANVLPLPFQTAPPSQHIRTNVCGTENFEHFKNKIRNNTMFVEFYSAGHLINRMHGIALDNNHVALPSHGFRSRKCDKLRIYNMVGDEKQLQIEVPIDYENSMISFRTCDDLVLLRTQRMLNKGSIINYLLPEGDIAPRQASILALRENNFIAVGMSTLKEFITDYTDCYWEKVYNGTRMSPVDGVQAGLFWTTNQKCDLYQDGDCGSALISSEDNGALLGFHCGIIGTKSSGWIYTQQTIHLAYCARLTREWFDRESRLLTHGLDIPTTGPRRISNATISQHGCPHATINLSECKAVHPDAIAGKFLPHIGHTLCQLSKFSPQLKTNMRVYPHVDTLATYGISCSKFVPNFSRQLSRSSYTIAVDEINQVSDDIPYNNLIHCANHFIRSTITKLDVKDIGWRDSLGKLEFSEVVHGIDNVMFVDHINYTTSAGFPWYKTKEKLGFTKTPLESHPEWMVDRVKMIESCYLNGERYNPVFCSHLKDEMMTEKKITQGKMRVFVGSPVDFTILLRMYFLSTIALIQRHNFVFETAVSIAAQKIDWTYLYDHMSNDGKNTRHIDGDYKAFDKSMHQFIVALACAALMEFIRESKVYTAVQLTAMHLMLQDVYDTLIDFDGTLTYVAGSNPSGHPLTVIINGIVNSIYIRCAYLTKYGSLSKFDEEVRVITYGDDNWISTGPQCTFTHSDMVQNLHGIVVYTSAEKDGSTYDYKHIGDVTFLKRSFTENTMLSEVYGRRIVTAPLDLDSIHNMLVAGANSACLSVVMMESMSSALNEIALHGQKQFDELLNICCSVMRIHGVGAYEFKNYYETLGTFFPKLKEENGSYLANCGMVRGPDSEIKILKGIVPTEHMGLRGETPQSREMSAKFFSFNSTTDAREYAQKGDTTASHTGDSIGPIGSAFNRDIKIATYEITEGSDTSQIIYPWQRYMAIPFIRDKIRNYSKFRADLVLTFVMNSNPFRYGAVMASYKPLTSWNSDVSGQEYRDNSGGCIDQGMIGDGFFVAPDPVALCAARIQRDHVMLYPQETEKAEMRIPFYHFNNYLPLVGDDDTKARAFRTLGRLTMNPLLALKTATNPSSVPVTIDIFARLENYDICGPSIQRQGNEYDPDLPISSTASAIASAASQLSTIPVIGWYATATSVFASTVADVARWFGFSNPVNVTNVNPFKLVRMTRWADTEAMQPLSKLALDPKNELSIDGRLVGVDNSDDMQIERICSKKFLKGVTSWTDTDAVDTIIQEGLVTPIEFHKSSFAAVGSETAVGSYNRFTLSPATWLSQPFTHWSGDLVLTFKILCSKFHKGRLRFIFDPAGRFINFTEGCVFSELFEIDGDSEYTVRIPWQGNRPVLDCLPLTSGTAKDIFFSERGGLASTGADLAPYTAGFWRLQVMTVLNSPIAADAFVMTTSRWENMRFFKPRSPFPSGVWQYTAPLTISRQGKEIDVPAQGNDTNVLPLIVGGETCLSIRQYMHRWCLANIYESANMDITPIATVFYQMMRRFPLFHGPCRSSPVASTGGATAAACRFGSTPLNYFTPAFMLRRGAVHWRFDPLVIEESNTLGNNWRTILQVRDIIISQFIGSGYSVSANPETVPTITAITNANLASMRLNWQKMNWDGCEIGRDSQQGIEVACPDYFSGRGRSCNQYVCNQDVATNQNSDCELNSTIPSLDNLEIRGQLVLPPASVNSAATTKNNRLINTSYCCAGADYSLHKFINVPTIYLGASDA